MRRDSFAISPYRVGCILVSTGPERCPSWLAVAESAWCVTQEKRGRCGHSALAEKVKSKDEVVEIMRMDGSEGHGQVGLSYR